MILKRLGNKSKIAQTIQSYFPAHKTYIETHFGGGGMFFNKSKAKYNIVNDLDSDVYNLYNVIRNNKEQFKEALELAPYHVDLLNYWKQNKETDPIQKAVRFVFLSNYTYLGAMKSLLFECNNLKLLAIERIKQTFDLISDVQFNNCDFEKFLNNIKPKALKDAFIYSDPPYLDTGDNYSDSAQKKDHVRLFDALEKTGSKFAVSEFDNEFVLNLAKERNLNIITIGDRVNLKNRRTEILITNYKPMPTLF